MTLRRVAEIGAALGTATLAGLNVLQHNHHKEQKRKAKHNHLPAIRLGHVALCSSLIATGLALWELKKDHHAAV